jgi:HSP20 family molecular chaperone IbpA
VTEKAVQRAREPVTVLKPFASDFFERAHSIFEQISRRAYEICEGRGQVFGRDLEDWFQAERELLHPIHIQVSKRGDAEVPGFNEKELSINVEPSRLVITGERETKKEQTKGETVYSEICADEIMRVIELPAEVETEKVTATRKDGILELSLPKTAKAKSVRIEPKVV